MATWTRFRYGAKSWRQGFYWVPSDDFYPATNPGRPCLIYSPGHGWEGRHPSFFYGPPDGVAEPLFTSHIEPAEATQEVVCISIWQASSNYELFDTFTHSDWNVGFGSYSEGAIVNDDGGAGELYRCRKTHTAAAANEPGTGANWRFFWIQLDPNDAGAFLYLPQTGDQAGLHPGMSPGFGGEGIRDNQAIVQWAKDNANRLGIDPLKIVTMGASAGGQASGAAAYSTTAPFVKEARADVYAEHARRSSSRPQATILDITPNDFRWYPFTGLMDNLLGRTFTATEWDRVDDQVKSGLSPLGVLNASGLHLPTYLAYAGSRFDHIGGTDDPPYAVGLYHEARNGWEILKALELLGQPNIVHLEDSLTGGFFERWTSTTASTQIPDTDRALDIWEWLKALPGWFP